MSPVRDFVTGKNMMRKKKNFSRLKEKKSKRKALECLGIAVLALVLFSCLSFDIGDWPSKFVYPRNEPSANLCGPIGAFCAYYLLYYVGPGVFVI